jgi:hypothetical protein
VRFTVEGEFQGFFLCHCSRCRKGTGSAHAANLFATKAVLHWLAGEEGVRLFRLPESRHTKSFCGNCGSALPYVRAEGVVVPAGSLDVDVTVPPNAHIHYSSRANWDHDLEKVPRVDGLPTRRED